MSKALPAVSGKSHIPSDHIKQNTARAKHENLRGNEYNR
eukprot:CAMPEP_0114050506 /NCGR_PEP_ID=MMETSP1339-20121228/65066_1 /TAXON_ID=94617 /ORGANISM="Fibrocapsa japonica" /LENGTH=38 /assembly_acc=CAM_ASM_000762